MLSHTRLPPVLGRLGRTCIQRRTMQTVSDPSNSTPTTPRKPKQEGDISSVFASLSGEAPTVFPQRFSDLKKEIIGTSSETQDRLVESWKDLLNAVKLGVEEIQQRGTDIIPEVSYEAVKNSKDSSWSAEVKKRGVVVVRDIVPDEEALGWKQQVKDYIKANPQVKGFPSDNKQVFEIYWSAAQLKARSHPDMLNAQKQMLKLFHAEPSQPISLETPVTYVDRMRIRLPGDAKFALGPHIDGGSIERWEDPIYRRCYKEILQGNWRQHDPYDVGRRLGANSDIYNGPSQCSAYRAWQGWLALSTTGPSEGTLRTFPLLKEASAYVILRPFFQPTLPSTHPDFLSANSWKLDLESTDFPNSALGRGQELNNHTHPHLRLDEGAMVSMKPVNPGDAVFWHCDGIHAVESEHRGQGDSSVFYIPSVPLTKHNVEYMVRQRESFTTLGGVPAPDFPGGDGERQFVGKGSVNDFLSDEGLRAMGIKPFAEWKGMSEGERGLIKETNNMLGF